MARIEDRVARLDAEVRAMATQLEKLDRSVHGTLETPGLATRVDRLEQSRLSFAQQVALYIAAVGALAALLQAFWTH